MSSPSHSRALHWFLHLSAGVLLAVLAIIPGMALDLAACWLALKTPLLALSLVLVLLGALTYRPRLARLSAGLCASIGFAVIGIGAGELFGRALGVDFRRTEAAMRRLPPYYRRPYVPSGEVFFRRPGPEIWEGKVISRVLDELRLETDAYADERAIRLSYDRDGFRNPNSLQDWDIVMVGDSFTELGFLPDDALFSSRLALALGCRVKNLGVSHTGPLSHLHFLREYGFAKSTRKAVVCFFEGNDPEDLGLEYGRLLRFERTGARPAGPLKRQSSLLRAVCEAALKGPESQLTEVSALPDAMLRVGEREAPVTLAYAPIGKDQVGGELAEAFESFFQRYRSLVDKGNLEPWLVYMPCKIRVWHGLLEFTEHAAEPLSDWEPTDLPEYLQELAQSHGIRFLDLTPALIRETRVSNRILFNTMVDSHLNGEGAAVVAEELRAALGGANQAIDNPGSDSGESSHESPR